MSILSVLAGVVVIAFTMVDFVWTTLSVRGAGPLTARLSAAMWAGFRAAGRGRLTLVLTMAGPAILVATLACWVVLLWLGWLLIFLADGGSVVQSLTKEPADLAGRIYFTGFVFSTLGVGDLIPKGDLWQVLTPLAALNGLIVTAVAITYLLNVLSAVIAKRQLAGHIHAIGQSPQEFLLSGWDGQRVSGLDGHLTSVVTPGLLQTAGSHLAYPILHYFHSERPDVSPALAIAVLDEAMTLLADGMAPDRRPLPSTIRPPRQAIDAFLDRLEQRYAGAVDDPPPPDLSNLREAGVPLADESEIAAVFARRAGRRRLLLAMVRDEGWEWALPPGRSG